ncbi:hypothetical protein KKA14_13025, partial [bacterium]|nr:hypothetical protein [bacterium]
MDELMTIPDYVPFALKENLLTLEKNTLLELLRDNGILVVKKWKNGISRDEIIELANSFQKRSSACALSLLLASSSILTVFTAMEFREWSQLGCKLLDSFPENGGVCDAYLGSSQLFLSKETISMLGGWVNQGLKIAEKSTAAGIEYFLSIPEFLAHGKQFHVREWSEKIKQLLLLDHSAEQAALHFIETSTELIKIMSFRELQSWSTAGVKIMKDSAPAGLKYFERIPEGIASLYRIEMRKVFEMTATIAGIFPGKAIDFYRKAPGMLLGLNPNIRESVLNKVKINSEKNPENICDLFDEIVAAAHSLPYPLQETVMKMENGIAELSKNASRAYFKNVNGLLKEVRESFLPVWVEKGCLLLREDERTGIEHFSLATAEAKEAYSKWKEAVFFDDQKNTLALFTRALCGRESRLQSSESLEEKEIKSIKRHQAEGGHVIFLPPFVAEETSRADNFSQYKVAAAHQAGYIEFETFGSKFNTIRTVLASFPLKELALEIFFILEDGRIDYNLKKEYAGLRKDIDRILKNSIEKRAYPIDNPFSEALEILLRMTVSLLDENKVSDVLSDYLMFLKNTMKGFFENASSVWDSFTKTLEVYNLISRFKEDTFYRAIVPLSFRELPDIELVSGGATDEVPDEVMAGDDESGDGGAEFSEEELQRMIDLLKETELLEPLKKGKGEQGLFITNLDKLISHDDDDVDPDISSVSAEKSSRLPSVTHSEHKRGPYYYDEWDYIQKAYRRKWCCLKELDVPTPGVELYDIIHKSYRNLIQQVKAQFQRIRPEVLNTIKRVEWGNEIDFNAMLESVVDRKIGDSPSDRIFMRREKKIRRISTLLLVDMSASTDRLASSVSSLTGLFENTGPGNQSGVESGSVRGKKIID